MSIAIRILVKVFLQIEAGRGCEKDGDIYQLLLKKSLTETLGFDYNDAFDAC